MTTDRDTIVLGSRSPRRFELLARLVDSSRIVVRPPLDSEELGFEGLSTWDAIDERLSEIVRTKSADVLQQTTESAVVLVGDTIIVGESRDGGLIVLGQPPANEWQDVVRSWFRDHLLDSTHTAATAVRLVDSSGRASQRIVRTRVTCGPADDDLVEWYLGTNESVGKAGGYALQGAGSLFVDRIDGSSSNVVGLPLRETRELLSEFRVL